MAQEAARISGSVAVVQVETSVVVIPHLEATLLTDGASILLFFQLVNNPPETNTIGSAVVLVGVHFLSTIVRTVVMRGTDRYELRKAPPAVLGVELFLGVLGGNCSEGCLHGVAIIYQRDSPYTKRRTRTRLE